MTAVKLIPREKRTLVTIALLSLGIVLMTFLETYLQGVPFSSRFITNNIIVFAVVNINIILLMILLLLVMRNLIKLYFEHRQKMLGSRFKTKLVVAFAALSIIPSVILFIISLNLIHNSIKNWFEVRVEEVLKGTTEISRTYYENLTGNGFHFARQISREIAGQGFLAGSRGEALSAFLEKRRDDYALGSLEIYDPRPEKVAAAYRPESGPPRLTRAARRNIGKALQGLESSLVEPEGRGEIIRCLVPISSSRPGGQIEGVLSLGTYVPASLAGQVAAITDTYENYRQSKILKSPIRVSYQLTLVMVTLLIIFSATWFAFYLAKFITVPIQHLAEGTRRISEGDLNFKIDIKSDDELGMLIDSFNHMTEDLRANKAKLETAYGGLERSHLELESRKLYIETVLDNIATGVLSLDQEGRLTTVNKAAQAMLGLDSARRVGLPYGLALGTEAYRDIRSFIDELHGQAVNWLERKTDFSAEGSQLNLLLIGSNLYDDKAGFSGTVIVIENLTELINAQRIAAWREVARRIAHEIKNPLTPIKLSAQRLRKKFFQRTADFDNVFDEGTQMIIQQVEELKKLVDEFSRFARMPSSKPAPVDIHVVLANTLKLYQDTYKGMTFRTVFHPEPLLTMVDAEQMKRAFVNLIDNGIEATEERGTIEVETAYDKNSRSVRIFFKDDGRGIPPEIREKLFIPYFSTKKEGTGLGLTIVSSIVSDHSGYIRVKNNSPRGTVFIIDLPAYKGERIKV